MQLDKLSIADAVLVVIIMVSAVFGVMRGFVKEVVALIVWSMAGVLSLAFGVSLGALMAENMDGRAQAALGIGTVFITVLIAGAIVQRLLRGLVQSTGLGGTDRTLGLVFGGVRGVAVAVLGLVFLRSFSANSAWWTASQLTGPLLMLEDDVLAVATAIKDFFSGPVGRDAIPGSPARAI